VRMSMLKRPASEGGPYKPKNACQDGVCAVESQTNFSGAKVQFSRPMMAELKLRPSMPSTFAGKS
jgi:hypothetical protein